MTNESSNYADLVKLLRANMTTVDWLPLMRAAADAIERLVRERDEARAEGKRYDKAWLEEIGACIDMASLAAERRVKLEAAEAEVVKWHGDAVRLQADNIRLREALQEVLDDCDLDGRGAPRISVYQRARAALEKAK